MKAASAGRPPVSYAARASSSWNVIRRPAGVVRSEGFSLNVLKADMNADPTTVTASVNQNHSRILPNSVLIPRRPLRRTAELVSHSADRLDQRVSAPDFLPQMADMHVDRAVERSGLAVIKILHQRVA